ESVRTIKQNNIQAFSLYAPYLLDFFNVFGDDTLSIFCTKQGKANIVDYSTGQCWYGEDPEAEINSGFKHDVSQVAKISLLEKAEQSTPFIDYVERKPVISPRSCHSMQGETTDIEGD
ncbi:hypothetical protein, partial [Grimontia celer]|uniref:hypothetical protein n=1 Tax=Grimontia celer TaxID=1796497 RepID=UPI000B2D9E17